MADTGHSNSDDEGLEAPLNPTETPTKKVGAPKVDRRRTGGLANRSPAQVKAYEAMRAASQAKLEAQRREKVEAGLKLLAEDSLAPERRAKKVSQKKVTRSGPGTLVFDVSNASSDSESEEEPAPRIVIKTSRKPRSKRPQTPEPEQETLPEPQPQPSSPKFSFMYV